MTGIAHVSRLDDAYRIWWETARNGRSFYILNDVREAWVASTDTVSHTCMSASKHCFASKFYPSPVLTRIFGLYYDRKGSASKEG